MQYCHYKKINIQIRTLCASSCALSGYGINADDDPQKMEDLKMNKDSKIIAITDLMNTSLKNIKEAIADEDIQNSTSKGMPFAMSIEHMNMESNMETQLEYVMDEIEECRERLKKLEREKAWLISWKTFVHEYLRTWEDSMKLMEQIPIADDDDDIE